MKQFLSIELQDDAPSWVEESQWFYENIYGDQWAAKIMDHKLYISYSNDCWETLELDYEQLKKAESTCLKDHVFMNKWVVNGAEYGWLTSILLTATAILENEIALEVI